MQQKKVERHFRLERYDNYMKILFLGDSITEGVGASCPELCYVNLVKEKLGCDVVNYGISGTRIARQYIDTRVTFFDWDFQQRAMIMDKDADLVFVFGGTNDYDHGNAKIGECTSTDPYTFCGGLNNLVNYLVSIYGLKKLCFLLPLRRYKEDNGENSLGEYVECMRKVLKKNKIKYLDFFETGISKPQTEKNEGYFCDGLHPNDKGHEWIANQIYEYIVSSFED